MPFRTTELRKASVVEQLAPRRATRAFTGPKNHGAGIQIGHVTVSALFRPKPSYVAKKVKSFAICLFLSAISDRPKVVYKMKKLFFAAAELIPYECMNVHTR